MSDHINLVNIHPAKGPKRKPHIQLEDGFCIQFVPFYLSYVGSGWPTKTLRVTVHASKTSLKISFHFLNRKLITEGILRYFCYKSTSRTNWQFVVQKGAGMQISFYWYLLVLFWERCMCIHCLRCRWRVFLSVCYFYTHINDWHNNAVCWVLAISVHRLSEKYEKIILFVFIFHNVFWKTIPDR